MDWKKFFEPNWSKLIAFIALMVFSSAIFPSASIGLLNSGWHHELSLIEQISAMLYQILNPFLTIYLWLMGPIMSISLTLSDLVRPWFQELVHVLDLVWKYALGCGIIYLINKRRK